MNIGRRRDRGEDPGRGGDGAVVMPVKPGADPLR